MLNEARQLFNSGLYRSLTGVIDEDINVPSWRLISADVDCFASGDNHGICETKDGLFQWGDIGKKCTLALTSIELKKQVKRVMAGGKTNLIETDQQEIYTWGLNNAGQCGIGRTEEHEIYQPQFVKTLSGLKHAVFALHHAIFVFEDKVMAVGKGYDGRLGVKTPGFYYDLQEVELPLPLKHVSASEGHSLAVDGSGQPYAWGSNDSGQLGFGNEKDQMQPKLVDSLMKFEIIQSAAGSAHSCWLVSLVE